MLRGTDEVLMNWLFSFLASYGMPAMLLFVLLEYACFPVSSEIVLPFCGALAAKQGIFYPLLVLLSAVAGLIGTTFCYGIGRLGGNTLLDKIMKRFPKTRYGLETSYTYFQKKGAQIVLLGRFIPLCRTYLGFVAGALRLPLASYLAYSFVGIFFWNAMLCGLGYFLQDNWPVVASWYTRYKNILLPALAILILLIIAAKCRKKDAASSKKA